MYSEYLHSAIVHHIAAHALKCRAWVYQSVVTLKLQCIYILIFCLISASIHDNHQYTVCKPDYGHTYKLMISFGNKIIRGIRSINYISIAKWNECNFKKNHETTAILQSIVYLQMQEWTIISVRVLNWISLFSLSNISVREPRTSVLQHGWTALPGLFSAYCWKISVANDADGHSTGQSPKQ